MNEKDCENLYKYVMFCRAKEEYEKGHIEESIGFLKKLGLEVDENLFKE